MIDLPELIPTDLLPHRAAAIDNEPSDRSQNASECASSSLHDLPEPYFPAKTSLPIDISPSGANSLFHFFTLSKRTLPQSFKYQTHHFQSIWHLTETTTRPYYQELWIQFLQRFLSHDKRSLTEVSSLEWRHTHPLGNCHQKNKSLRTSVPVVSLKYITPTLSNHLAHRQTFHLFTFYHATCSYRSGSPDLRYWKRDPHISNRWRICFTTKDLGDLAAVSRVRI